MAEPFAKPNKEQMKKALQLYSDPVLYWATNCAVKALQQIQEEDSREAKDINYKLYSWWRKYSRLMFLNFPAILVHAELYEIYSEWAEKQFEIPEIKEKYENMISEEWKSG